MQVSLSLKNWKVVQDEKTKLPRVQGSYSVMMGEKEIAVQDFNTGYNAKELSFSGDVYKAFQSAEDVLKAELTQLLS
jgi:hypothetical protein